MRALPDNPGDKNYPREEWIDQGKVPDTKKSEDVVGNGHSPNEEQSGNYVVGTLAKYYIFIINRELPFFRIMRWPYLTKHSLAKARNYAPRISSMSSSR